MIVEVTQLRICAIIPAYNEEKTIEYVIKDVKKYIKDVFVIDDCSTEDTYKIAKEAGALVVRHHINRGVGGALRTGYKIAISSNFDYILQIDSDGQHDPKYIPQMLKTAKEGDYDLVIGSRFLNPSYREYSAIRKVGVVFFTFLVNFLTTSKVTDVTSGFRVYKAESLKKMTSLPDKHWAVEQTMEFAKKDMKIKEVSVEMPVRKEGKSQFNPRTFLLYPIRMAETILRVLLFRS